MSNGSDTGTVGESAETRKQVSYNTKIETTVLIVVIVKLVEAIAVVAVCLKIPVVLENSKRFLDLTDSN